MFHYKIVHGYITVEDHLYKFIANKHNTSKYMKITLNILIRIQSFACFLILFKTKFLLFWTHYVYTFLVLKKKKYFFIPNAFHIMVYDINSFCNLC